MSLKYKTVLSPAEAVYRDRGSRFIGYAFPVVNNDGVKKYLEQIQQLHPKATHHCFAFRIGTDGNNFRASDAGEPAGTAGRPILGQIDSHELTNILVIVVRYFGGTKLGVPALIAAYKAAAAGVLEVSEIVEKEILEHFVLTAPYELSGELFKIIAQCKAQIIQRSTDEAISVEIALPPENVQKLKDALPFGGKVSIQHLGAY